MFWWVDTRRASAASFQSPRRHTRLAPEANKYTKLSRHQYNTHLQEKKNQPVPLAALAFLYLFAKRGLVSKRSQTTRLG
jgi:hypothetical protein